MAILLVRHGQTDDNVRLVFQGQGGHGLNARGREQAQELRDRLKGGPRLSRLWASDLERARQTAEIVAEPTGLPVALDKQLREVDVGNWTGRNYTDIERELPEEWAAWVLGLDVRRGGGETYAELADRLYAAMERIADEHAADPPGQHVLVVSHGAAIKCFAAKVLGLDNSGRAALGPVKNTSVTVLSRRSNKQFEILVWNDTAHLGDPLQEL
jgi:probable phosphoglycerate mutase